VGNGALCAVPQQTFIDAIARPRFGDPGVRAEQEPVRVSLKQGPPFRGQLPRPVGDPAAAGQFSPQLAIFGRPNLRYRRFGLFVPSNAVAAAGLKTLSFGGSPDAACKGFPERPWFKGPT